MGETKSFVLLQRSWLELSYNCVVSQFGINEVHLIESAVLLAGGVNWPGDEVIQRQTEEGEEQEHGDDPAVPSCVHVELQCKNFNVNCWVPKPEIINRKWWKNMYLENNINSSQQLCFSYPRSCAKLKYFNKNYQWKHLHFTNSQISLKGFYFLMRFFLRRIDMEGYCKRFTETLFWIYVSSLL